MPKIVCIYCGWEATTSIQLHKRWLETEEHEKSCKVKGEKEAEGK